MEAPEKEEEQKHNLKSWGDLGGWKGPYLPLYKLVFKALRPPYYLTILTAPQ